ncbi:hypothetical protein F5Y18DRAFT_233000 [Xylariaceae sp. FL1019]|nr:hypothetical protein F5Y18DRAFT_233000 [Xylariaceae sp. FL1019]
MGKSKIPSARIQLAYPLFACDFVDPNHLVVAGGGGPGNNGVGNKVTLLDLSDPSLIAESAELELSAKEDSVMSMVVAGPQKDRPSTTTLFAGVNSSPGDIKNGQNRHFRALSIAQPGKSAKTGGVGGVKISELKRDALFVHGDKGDKDTYQRVLRLSAPHDGLTSPRLGAAATGLSKKSQIVLFDVPSTNSPQWKSRGRLELSAEAMDLDVIQTGPETYQLAYCDEDELFTVEVSKDEVSEPRCIYTITPEPGETAKPTFKSLRYLTTGFVVTVINHPKADGSGVSLHGIRLPSDDGENGRLSIRAKLPKTVSKATSLAVRNLSPTAMPQDKQGDAQFVIAVAGNDSSISLYTMEHKAALTSEVLADLAPFQIIKSVHPSSITNLSFSTFTPPMGSSKTPSDLCVKLASVSVDCSTVVHSIPIKKHSGQGSAQNKRGPPKLPRFIVALKSKGESSTVVLSVAVLMLLLVLLVGQVLLEAKDIVEPTLGARKVLPTSWTRPLRKTPRIREQPVEKQKTIEDLLADVNAHHTQQMVIKHDDLGVVGPDGLPALHVGVHDGETHGPATEWQNLDKKDQDLWKKRLEKSGHYVGDMGENIFKGVLFGEIGGAIGNIVGEAL